MKSTYLKIFFGIGLLSFASPSCKKFIDIGLPKTELIKATVFKSDNTAIAAISNIYAQMASGFAGGGTFSISFLASLSSDELDIYNANTHFQEFFNSAVQPLNAGLATVSGPWGGAYQQIYRANAVLEGLISSNEISAPLKMQLEGEAKFIRAFCHFYLINLFGDVPLVLTTDYRVNAVIPRRPKSEIYQQIIADLKDAQNLMADDYSFSKNERVRPNKWAATAMLARVYLYNNDWVNSEDQATQVINKNTIYSLASINGVFLKNSAETIWQLAKDNGNATDATTFFMSATAIRPTNAALRESFFMSFANNDLRKINWIITRNTSAGLFQVPAKYKVTAATPITEYSMVLRLAESYLIRAEARAHQNKLLGSNSAESDLNTIRSRAGLPGNTAITKEEILLAIENERNYELFTEWGHRWLDLKRTNRVDAVLTPLKGANWQTTDKLYPIPQNEINNNPSLIGNQNPGYN